MGLDNQSPQKVEVELQTPNGPWPASEYGPFVNIKLGIGTRIP